MINHENEFYLAIVGKKLGKYWLGYGVFPTEGSPDDIYRLFGRSTVEFDHESIYKKRRNLIGFYHTHPQLTNTPSRTDYQTMAGWTVALGKPLACLIDGSNGLGGHWFLDDETPHVTTKAYKLGNLFWGALP